MSKAAHTPAPWRLHDMERATIVAGKPGGEVANCLNGFGDQDANARLIAAAPDMLAELRVAVRHIEHMAAWIGKKNAGYSFEGLGEDMPGIRAAIAKATAP